MIEEKVQEIWGELGTWRVRETEDRKDRGEERGRMKGWRWDEECRREKGRLGRG